MVAGNFEEFWEMLATDLRTRKRVKNWTADKGHYGEDFVAEYSGGDYVRIISPAARTLIWGPKEEFRMIFEKWQEYVAGKIPRNYFRDRSRFTKYTISITRSYKNS